jgi:hypothetical protein
MSGENDLFCIEPGQKRPWEATLARVVSSTFEKIGFMEARATDAEPAALNPITATMEILSPQHARVFFSAPQHLGWTIAENLYGPEDLTLEVVGDMIGELLNTITGSLLSELLPDRQFSLSIPRLIDALPEDGHDQTFVYRFTIDNNDVITLVLAVAAP